MDAQIIYTFIPCRLDKEIIPTVYDLFAKADEPQNIRVVIFNQDRTEDCFTQDLFPENVLLVNVDYNKFSNICFIRSLDSYFAQPSDKYFLSIDSHCRFDQDWDTILKTNLPDKGILSAYPPPYQLYGSALPANNTHCANDFNREFNGGFPFVMKPCNEDVSHCRSTIAAGFLFTSIEWLKDVGYNKHLCWKYEEIDLTYRSIGAGYSIVNYKHTPIYHLYERSNSRKLDDHQEIFLTDCNEEWRNTLNPTTTKAVNEYYDIDFETFLKKLYK